MDFHDHDNAAAETPFIPNHDDQVVPNVVEGVEKKHHQDLSTISMFSEGQDVRPRDEALNSKKETNSATLHIPPTFSFSSSSQEESSLDQQNRYKLKKAASGTEQDHRTTILTPMSFKKDNGEKKTMKHMRLTSRGSFNSTTSSNSNGDIFERLFHTSNEATRNREKLARERIKNIKLRQQQMSQVHAQKKIPLSKASCFYDRNMEWLVQREKLVREKAEYIKQQQELQICTADDSKKVPLSEASCFYDRNIEWLVQREMRLMQEARKNELKLTSRVSKE